MAKVGIKPKQAPASAELLALRAELMSDRPRPLATLSLGDTQIELLRFGHALWAVMRCADGDGGIALRAVHAGLPFVFEDAEAAPGEHRRYRLITDVGDYSVAIAVPGDGREQFRMRTCFTPAVPTLIPYQPRDLVPLGHGSDPLATTGTVEAQQRGLNAAFLFFRIDEPDCGTVLYFQDLTPLNDYFVATGTKPKEVVGAEWPELGYRLPTFVSQGVEPKPLPAGKEVVLSDAVLVLRRDRPAHERESARQFLQMLGAAYEMIERPPTEYHDWVRRADQTVEDLASSPKATVEHYGATYVHPYTDAEYPDSMVQISLVAALHDWSNWCDEPVPLERRLAKGLSRFYDPKLGTFGR